MHLIDSAALGDLLPRFGYLAVFLVIMGESSGIPLPGETVLIAAAIFASRKHGLDIRLIVGVAILGAVLGDNIGFWIGRELGFRVLARYGARFGFDRRRQKLGRYLFRRYGGAVVFFGRFAAVLRTYAALLAGANRLRPLTFFLYNAAGGVVWACLYGFGAYLLGVSVERIAGPIGYVALVLAVGGAFLLWRFYKRNEERLLATAEREIDDADLVEPDAAVS